MQPSPIAETRRPADPSCRVITEGLLHTSSSGKTYQLISTAAFWCSAATGQLLRIVDSGSAADLILINRFPPASLGPRLAWSKKVEHGRSLTVLGHGMVYPTKPAAIRSSNPGLAGCSGWARAWRSPYALSQRPLAGRPIRGGVRREQGVRRCPGPGLESWIAGCHLGGRRPRLGQDQAGQPRRPRRRQLLRRHQRLLMRGTRPGLGALLEEPGADSGPRTAAGPRPPRCDLRGLRSNGRCRRRPTMRRIAGCER